LRTGSRFAANFVGFFTDLRDIAERSMVREAGND
jgi:hypothetical protein